MFTLWQITTLDHWAEHIVRHVIQVQPILAFFFVGMILLCFYGVLNLVVGVIVEATLNMAKQNKAKAGKKKGNEKKRISDQIMN